MLPESSEGPSWKAGAVALLAVVVLAGGALVLFGSQVSAVLSTVGGSVGGAPTGQDTGNQSGGAEGGTGDGSSGSDGSSGESGGDPGGGSAGSGPGTGRSEILLDVSRPELLVIKTGEMTVQVIDI